MNDDAIRAALIPRLRNRFQYHDDTVLLEEFGIMTGRVRVDVAAVNGHLAGFEIKSGSDRLDRLPTQMTLYGMVFDRLTLVTESCHLDDAMRMLPNWWGIELAASSSAGLRFQRIRQPKSNPTQDMNAFVQLLWRPEVVEELAKLRDIPPSRVRGSRFELWPELVQSLSRRKLHHTVLERIKARGDWRSVQQPW